MCAPISVSMAPTLPLTGVFPAIAASLATGVAGVSFLVKGLIRKSRG